MNNHIPLVSAVFLFLLTSTEIFSQTYCVRAAASGANHGSDWDNAFTSLPENLESGATYFVAQGTYSSEFFDNPALEAHLVSIVRATALNHGTDQGWIESFGKGRVVFQAPSRESSLKTAAPINAESSRSTSGNNFNDAAPSPGAEPDSSAPSIEPSPGPRAQSITSSQAVIAWETNELSTSEVEYGPTQLYGFTARVQGFRTIHEVPLDGLQAAGQLYHFRVRSEDAAGNSAVSLDHTFSTTPQDVIAPSCSLQAILDRQGSLLDGNRLTEEVTFTAIAADNAGGSGLAGVEFFRDGLSLGQASTVDGSSFTLEWNTYSGPNGPFELTARAVDLEGNIGYSKVVAVKVANPYPDLRAGLIGHWNFNVNGETIVHDVSGQDHHGSVSNPGGSTPSKNIRGLLFSAANESDHIDLPAINVSGDQITLVAWLRPQAFDLPSRIIAKANGTGDDFWLLDIDGDTNEFGFRVHSGSSAARISGGTVELAKWVHVVGVYDGEAMHLYKNGVKVASTPKTGLIRTGSAPVCIGDNPLDGQKPFEGVIDDMRIYDRALSSAEILALLAYASAPPVVKRLSVKPPAP